jgi:hypothetical protein
MTPVKWGKNGAVDRRLQRYIAARLGPLPGWSMGYGFDLQEWVVRDDLRKWHEYMHQHLGWFHFLSGRGIGPAVYDPKEVFPQPAPHYYEGLDYSAYDQMRPGYDAYVASIEASPDKPSLSEDRFRIRPASCGHAGKDYDEEMTRRGLWQAMMAGGVANIWANLSPDCGGTSKPYQHPEWIKTCTMFFRTRFLADMHPGNDLTDFRNGSSLTDSTLNCCLQDAMNTHYIFYKEDAQSIRMDLSGMAEKQPAVAVDTKKPYGEISLGILNSANQTWQAPYQSDWAIAVGEYPKIP